MQLENLRLDVCTDFIEPDSQLQNEQKKNIVSRFISFIVSISFSPYNLHELNSSLAVCTWCI